MIKTSIVIPVKDDEHIFICLGKISNSKRKDLEIIIVNDKNSKEEFSNRLKDSCKKFSLKYLRANIPGAAHNRNIGMSSAKGSKILFIDSDCFPDKNWISEMESSLDKYDLVEGKIVYNSKSRTVLDRSVENLKTPNLFLTANLGIRKEVSKKCKFDERFIVFREDTDFGLSALENGFFSKFNENAIVFHKQAKFTAKRFIFERERYIGEPLIYKKHQNSPSIKNYISKLGRILYPSELIFSFLILVSLFFNPIAFLVFYLFPGTFYLSKKYLSKKYTWNTKDTLIVLFFLPLTMFVKRLSIWKGAIKFKFFVI